MLMPGRNFLLHRQHAHAALAPAVHGVELLHLGEIRIEVDLFLSDLQLLWAGQSLMVLPSLVLPEANNGEYCSCASLRA